jgi:hypothetical protein
MKTLASVIAATFCLAASPLAVSPAAAEYLFYRNSSVLDHRQFGVPLNRLDRDDLAREIARELEHRRIRTRLGDPGQACAAMAAEGRALSPDLLVVICR